jgi:hypothetical protein
MNSKNNSLQLVSKKGYVNCKLVQAVGNVCPFFLILQTKHGVSLGDD